MEFIVLVLIVVGIVVIFLNKSSIKDRTVVRQTKSFDTPDGRINIERTTVIDNNRTNFHMPNSTDLPSADSLHNSVLNRSAELKSQPIKQIQQNVNISTNTNILLTKTCSHCNKSLPINYFFASKKHSDGYSKWCKDCLSQLPQKDNSKYKICPQCKQRRMKTSFYKNSKRNDGLTKWCKTCMDKSR